MWSQRRNKPTSNSRLLGNSRKTITRDELYEQYGYDALKLQSAAPNLPVIPAPKGSAPLPKTAKSIPATPSKTTASPPANFHDFELGVSLNPLNLLGWMALPIAYFTTRRRKEREINAEDMKAAIAAMTVDIHDIGTNLARGGRVTERRKGMLRSLVGTTYETRVTSVQNEAGGTKSLILTIQKPGLLRRGPKVETLEISAPNATAGGTHRFVSYKLIGRKTGVSYGLGAETRIGEEVLQSMLAWHREATTTVPKVIEVGRIELQRIDPWAPLSERPALPHERPRPRLQLLRPER